MELVVFMEKPLETRNDLWTKDAMVKITVLSKKNPRRPNDFSPLAPEQPIVLVLYDKIKKDAKGKIERDYASLLFEGSLISEDTLAPASPEKIRPALARYIAEKIRHIFPDRDLTLKQFRNLVTEINPAFLLLAESCLEKNP